MLLAFCNRNVSVRLFQLSPVVCRSAEWTILWSHGNGADLGIMFEYLRAYSIAWRVNIVAYEYPSYGLCDGLCSEASINASIEEVPERATN
jgi:hypothetical protein